MTFLLDEDDALKKHLQGMTVTDQKAAVIGKPRAVRVWFGQPDQEITDQIYPYMVIDMIDIQRDNEREHRGLVSPDYLVPSTLDAGDPFIIHTPIPVMIDYQITSYARDPRHDRAIISQLLFSKTPFRFGTLSVDTGQVDLSGNPVHTMRRMDILDIAKRDVTENQKRLFVNAVTARVSSEIPYDLFTELFPVTSVSITNPTIVEVGGRPGKPTFTGPGTITITH